MKKTKKSHNNKINILSIIEIISLIIFNFLLLKIDLLSNKYTLILIATSIIITVLSIIFINLKNKAVKIIGIIIGIILILLSCTGSYFLYKGNTFLNESFNNVSKETSTYYIVTSQSNKIDTKNDIKGNISYYKETVNVNKAIKKLQNDLNFKTNIYDNINGMFYDTLNNNIDLFLIDSASYHVIFELNKNLKEEDFKIVYKFDVKTKFTTNNKTKEKFNIFIGGTDFAGLMDYNAIVTVNTKTHEILLTSIPRDYYMEIYGMDGKKDTLSHMNSYGPDTNMKSLEQFFDTKIDYSIKINTKSLVGVVDAVGGITYCSDQSFTTSHALILDSYDDRGKQKLFIKKGCQELNGIETLTLARERMALVGRDRMRQKNCQKIIIAIFDKLKSTNSIANYNEILDSLSDLYTTTIPRDVISNIAKETLDGAEWKIITQSVDGSDSTEFITIINGMGYAMIPTAEDVINAKIKINELLKK